MTKQKANQLTLKIINNVISIFKEQTKTELKVSICCTSREGSSLARSYSKQSHKVVLDILFLTSLMNVSYECFYRYLLDIFGMVNITK